jgi:hypothetical protein
MAQKFRTLISAPDTTVPEDGDVQKAVLKNRHTRLNQLGAEGWELQTTVALDGTFIDTLSQPLPTA